MSEFQSAGYFEESFVRGIMREVRSPIADAETINLMEPTIQRKVARLSIIRAEARCKLLGENPTEVFRRILPLDRGQVQTEFVLKVDFNDPQQTEELEDLYRYLVSWEGKGDTAEIISYLDEFVERKSI